MRQGVVNLSDEIKGVVTVTDDRGSGKGLESFFVIFNFGNNGGGSFQLSPLPRLTG